MPNPPDIRSSAALSRASLRGFFYSFGGQGTRLLVALGQVAVLSRLLPPEVWGLFGVTWAVLVLIYSNRDMGISSAVIQREDYTEELANAAFWLSSLTGIVLAAVVVLLGFPLAQLYRMPEVVGVCIKFAPLFVLSGMSIHYQAIMRRRMQYLKLNIFLTIAQVVGTGGAILLAMAGLGINALIFLLAGQELVILLLAMAFSGWRPSRPAFHGHGRSLLSFGGDLSVFRFAQTFATAMDHMALGYFFNKEVAGFYNRGQTLFATPRRQLVSPFLQVAPTWLSRLQRDPDAFGRASAKMFNVLAYMWFPFLALLGAIPEPVIRIVLGDQYLDIVPLLPILALVEITRLHLNLLTVAETQLARTRSLRNFGLVTAPIMAAALIFGARGGAIQMATFYAPTLIGIFFWRVFQISGNSPLKWQLVLGSLANPALLGLCLFTCFKMSLLPGFRQEAPIMQLLVSLVVGALGALVLCLLWKPIRTDLAGFTRTLRGRASPIE